jgi:hypothetical protein
MSINWAASCCLRACLKGKDAMGGTESRNNPKKYTGTRQRCEGRGISSATETSLSDSNEGQGSQPCWPEVEVEECNNIWALCLWVYGSLG